MIFSLSLWNYLDMSHKTRLLLRFPLTFTDRKLTICVHFYLTSFPYHEITLRFTHGVVCVAAGHSAVL